MDSSKTIQDDDIKSKHSKKGGDPDESQNNSKKGDDNGSGEDDNDEEEEVLISEFEMKKLKECFKKLARNGLINVEEALVIVKKITEDNYFAEEDIFEILADEEVDQSRRMTEKNFIELIEQIKRKQNQSNEADTLLAYVAMGGDQDRGGYVDAQKLISIIKDDFEMTIDIEKLIDEIDEDKSGKVEYGEFNQLLNAD
ncbi:UNKNOWN [Stylonychia lemnae]|uniref:EF-hand domain-containing protein n=1 Tax=Stylonychia lemnae TaxID=5949 RepID=A0A078A1Q3_STYLE|nr:UNKNOWN [Stylonychia lemnae]|eukprot:CDW75393.1 UNKNOWN [Stylonychia lemnae]